VTILSRLRFEQPPAKTYRTANISESEKAANKLRQRPDEWACIAIYDKGPTANTFAHQIRHGQIPAFKPEGSFEATARAVGNEHRVYARYVGLDGERP
jgi:hypothetical protein